VRGSRGRRAVAGAPRALLCCCILHTAAYPTLLARCINIITRCPRWRRVRHMLSFSVGFEFRRSTRSVETVLLVVPPHAPTNACRACASALASFSFAFFLSRLSRAIRAILFNGGTAATAAATNTRASIVRRDCVFVFATPPNGLLLSPAVRRQAFLQRYYRIPLLTRSLVLVPTRAFWDNISRARNLWRFVMGTTRRVCMRALNTTASTFPDALRSQKKKKIESRNACTSTKQRDRLHDAIAQSRGPPLYTVASRVDRASFYAV